MNNIGASIFQHICEALGHRRAWSCQAQVNAGSWSTACVTASEVATAVSVSCFTLLPSFASLRFLLLLPISWLWILILGKFITEKCNYHSLTSNEQFNKTIVVWILSTISTKYYEQNVVERWVIMYVCVCTGDRLRTTLQSYTVESQCDVLKLRIKNTVFVNTRNTGLEERRALLQGARLRAGQGTGLCSCQSQSFCLILFSPHCVT